jgi:hypothetical protein
MARQFAARREAYAFSRERRTHDVDQFVKRGSAE